MSFTASDERIREVLDYEQKHGTPATNDNFGFKSGDTIDRYHREAKKRGIHIAETSRVLKAIGDKYSPAELKAIANGARVTAGQSRIPTVNFTGEHIKIGYLTDTHLGSVYCNPDHIYAAFSEFEKEGVDFICHSGDVTEGMSHRPGHVYELTHIGYAAQKQHAIEVMGKAPAPLYMIDGNHDRWYIKSNGALIVQDIAEAIEHATFLGHDEGDINLGSSATLKMWHGEDGNSYAISYRIQKVVESLTGGEKPNIMLFGHVHKSLMMYERHIHCVGGGCIEQQSKWMRGKRIQAHTGFWILDVIVNESGVARFGGTWYPFYV